MKAQTSDWTRLFFIHPLYGSPKLKRRYLRQMWFIHCMGCLRQEVQHPRTYTRSSMLWTGRCDGYLYWGVSGGCLVLFSVFMHTFLHALCRMRGRPPQEEVKLAQGAPLPGQVTIPLRQERELGDGLNASCARMIAYPARTWVVLPRSPTGKRLHKGCSHCTLRRNSILFHEGILLYRGLSRAITRVSLASKDRVVRGKQVRLIMLNDDLSEQDRIVFTQVRREAE
jgi:hypothetical protein